MGFSLFVGHASGIFEPEAVESELQQVIAVTGPGVPLGEPGLEWSTGSTMIGEMGWSWWGQMQALVERTLGPGRSPHTRAVDAWHGVYVDARVRPGVVDGASVRPAIARSRPGWFTRWRAERRLKRGDPSGVIDLMAAEHAPGGTDRNRLQIGDVRALREELQAALLALGHEPTVDSMESLIASCLEVDDEQLSEDGGLLCLAHAWIATDRAIEMKAPLWLVK